MVIADTGFWLALANRKDHQHAAAAAALEQLNEPLITTWPVLTETCHLLLTRIHHKSQLAFIKSIEQGACSIFLLTEKHLPRIKKLMTTYRQLPMDLGDASLVVLAEHLGHGKILSTDQRDFKTYRWKNTKPFTNLMMVEH